MTLPVFESFAVGIEGSSDTDVTVTKPSGVAVDDLLVAFYSTDGAGESLQPPGDDWVKGCTNFGGAMTTRWFWKYATAADVSATDYTFTLGSSEQQILGMARISGVDLNIPIDTQAGDEDSSDTPTCPDVTTSVDDCLILRMFGADDDDITVDSGYPAGTTGVYVRESATGIGTVSQGLAHEPQVSAGAVGAAAFTIDASEQWSALTIAVRPPQAVPTGKDVKFKHFHYALPTGTGNDSKTGIGFTPKALLLWGNTATGGGANVDFVYWAGMTDGINEFAVMVTGEDGAMVTQRLLDESNVLSILDADSATPVALAGFVSFDADGFTLNFATGAPAGMVAHGIAIGGDDAEVFCGSMDADAEAGIQNGVGFPLDLIYTFTSGQTLGSGGDSFGIEAHGFAARQVNQGKSDITVLHDSATLVTYCGNDASDQDAKQSTTETGLFIAQQFADALSWGLRMDQVFGQGFNFGNIENTDGYYFLAVRTGALKAKVGNFTKATGAAPVVQSLPDLGFTPQAYGLMSAFKTDETNTPSTDARISIGTLSQDGGTTQGSVAAHDTNNAQDGTQRQEAAILMQKLGASDALIAEAIGAAVGDSTPSFTWDPNDANADIIAFWAVEKEPAVPTTDQNPIIVMGTNF